MKFNRIILPVFLFGLLLLSPIRVLGSVPDLYFFYGDGCLHCAKAEDFFKSDLLKEYPDLIINKYEVYFNQENSSLFEKVADEFQVKVAGVPFLVIGDKPFIGFGKGITDREIKQQIDSCLTRVCPDLVVPLLNQDQQASVINDGQPNLSVKFPSIERSGVSATTTVSTSSKLIALPLLGEVDPVSFSLPLLTIVMGLLDGFNPCAMWALVFLITLLLGVEDRKRVWVLGSAFIFTSAVVYFFFMSAWLNIILLLGFIVWLRWGIGLLALGGGAYSLRDYFTKKQNVCEVSRGEKQQKFLDKMRLVVQQNNFWLALGGIIILAVAINLVEMICSAGLPAIYTQVLALSELTTWQYYAYLLLYIFFFMLDDMAVFAIAMVTLKMTNLSDKYSRLSRLVGGIIMILIGLLLIFRPELLMFG